MTDPLQNPIGYMQEFCQKYNSAPFPQYIEIGVSGPDHNREFVYECVYDGRRVTGKAKQKKLAKSDAAKAMYELLQMENYFSKFHVNKKSYDECDNKISLNVSSNSIVRLPESTKNPISALQEWCQGKKSNLPLYFESSTGNGFVCECSVSDKKTYGQGSSKKNAKTESAARMCIALQIPFTYENQPSTYENTQEFNGEKNAISALEELCNCAVSFPKPIYVNNQLSDNNFLVVCNVGTVRGEGRNSTKKGAKMLAANSVLGKLLQQGITINDTNTPKTESNYQRNEKPGYVSVLEEFNLSSEDEADDVKPVVDSLLNHDISKTLESLNLNDSLIEVEPSTVTIKEEVKDHSEWNDVDTKIRMKETLLDKFHNGDDEQYLTQKAPTSETLLKWAQNDKN